MPMDQFSAFVSLLPEIEAVLKESGQTVPRPDYTGVGGPPVESDDEDASGDQEDSSRKNIDATSDEDEEDEE